MSHTLTDIRDRSDLELLVKRFYEQLMVDPIVGFFFTDIARIDLEAHLPKIVNFWEMQLFAVRNFQGNTYMAHQLLNQQAHLSPDHFHRWLLVFINTVDALFIGDNAEKIKRNAQAIAAKMSQALQNEHASRADQKTDSGVQYFEQ